MVKDKGQMMKKIILVSLVILSAMSLSAEALAMQIFVEMPDKRTIELEVESGDSVDNVKQKIQDKEGVPANRQYLHYNGVCLQEEKTLADYNIQKESMLTLGDAPKNAHEGLYTIDVGGTFQAADEAATVISVDVVWEAMDFTYTGASQGTWNPNEGIYENAVAGAWSDHTPSITLQNHSNADLSVDFDFTQANGVTGIVGTFTRDTGEGTQEVRATQTLKAVTEGVLDAPKLVVNFGISGSGIDADQTLGTITVTMKKRGKTD